MIQVDGRNTCGDFGNKNKAIEYNYVRLLNAEGKAIRAAQGAFDKQGSWHEYLDPYAYNWKETKAGAEALQDLRNFDKKRRDVARDSSKVLQFFWSTRAVHDLINRADPQRISKHVVPKRNIAM